MDFDKLRKKDSLSEENTVEEKAASNGGLNFNKFKINSSTNADNDSATNAKTDSETVSNLKNNVVPSNKETNYSTTGDTLNSEILSSFNKDLDTPPNSKNTTVDVSPLEDDEWSKQFEEFFDEDLPLKDDAPIIVEEVEIAATAPMDNPFLDDEDEEFTASKPSSYPIGNSETSDGAVTSNTSNAFFPKRTDSTRDGEDSSLVVGKTVYDERFNEVKKIRDRKKKETTAQNLRERSNPVARKESNFAVETTFSDKGSKEVLVSPDGRLVPARDAGEFLERLRKFDDSIDEVKKVSLKKDLKGDSSFVEGGDLEGKVFYPWMDKTVVAEGVETPKVGGRIKNSELEFFKNFNSSKRNVVEDSLSSELRSNVLNSRNTYAKRRSDAFFNGVVGDTDAVITDAKRKVSYKDLDLLLFLMKFRYASTTTVASLLGVTKQSAYRRLLNLKKLGFVTDHKIWGDQPIWLATPNGATLSGSSLYPQRPNEVKLGLMSHQFVVNHVAAHLWGGNVNVLQLDDFPLQNRVDAGGKVVFGETLVSETELHSSQLKVEGDFRASFSRPKIMARIAEEFEEWESLCAENIEYRRESPEMSLGNEYMWVLWPPSTVNLNWHFPDLVVKRPRNLDGTPESIAVEIELNKKPKSYEKTLESYRLDPNNIYKKVIWVVQNRGVAKKLAEEAKKLKMDDNSKFDIVPILINNDEKFGGSSLWTL